MMPKDGNEGRIEKWITGKVGVETGDGGPGQHCIGGRTPSSDDALLHYGFTNGWMDGLLAARLVFPYFITTCWS